MVEEKNDQDHQSDDERRPYSDLSFHSLLLTLSSFLGASGASQGVAGDIGDHDSEAMKRHYTKIDLETKRAALTKLPAL